MKPSASIGRKLRWLGILSSGSAILAASLALLLLPLQEMRRGVRSRLETVADLIASNAASAVDFNDAEAAGVMLRWLKTRPEIVSAGIVVNGRVFAMYGKRANPPEHEDLLHTPAAYRFTAHDLTVLRPVTSAGRALGTLFIQSNLQEIDQTWRRFAAIAAIVAIPALLIAVLISQLLQRAISRPILGLASLAATVSYKKDYSVRAASMPCAAEIEQLVDTFNQMLGQVGHQNGEVQRLSVELEQRVRQRTAQLRAAMEELEAFFYSVSHDLRAPLRHVQGFTELLAEATTGQLSEKAARYLKIIGDASVDMGHLIDDLLSFSSMGLVELTCRTVPLAVLVQDVLQALAMTTRERKIT